jgi:hypothetical protein
MKNIIKMLLFAGAIITREQLLLSSDRNIIYIAGGVYSRHSDSSDQQMHLAIYDGNLPLVKSLLAAKTSPNTQEIDDKKSPASYSPLHHSIIYGQKYLGDYTAREQITKVLLNARANINAQCEGAKFTPLMLAVKFAESDLIANLIDRKADVNCVDSIGRTALSYYTLRCAQGRGDHRIIPLLQPTIDPVLQSTIQADSSASSAGSGGGGGSSGVSYIRCSGIRSSVHPAGLQVLSASTAHVDISTAESATELQAAAAAAASSSAASPKPALDMSRQRNIGVTALLSAGRIAVNSPELHAAAAGSSSQGSVDDEDSDDEIRTFSSLEAAATRAAHAHDSDSHENKRPRNRR